MKKAKREPFYLYNFLSEKKSRKFERLTYRLFNLMQKEGIKRGSFTFISKDCGTSEEKDYFNTTLLDVNGNMLYDLCVWEKRS